MFIKINASHLNVKYVYYKSLAVSKEPRTFVASNVIPLISECPEYSLSSKLVTARNIPEVPNPTFTLFVDVLILQIIITNFGVNPSYKSFELLLDGRGHVPILYNSLF